MDKIMKNDPLARMYGVGPRLAALEKMVYPKGALSGMIGQALDSIGDAVGGALGGGDVVQPVPREEFPRILFIWGPSRILPVVIESMTINEKLYDASLNPIQAEVTVGLSVPPPDPCNKDLIAQGALEYTNLLKDAQAVLNLANTAQDIMEIIPF
jgi:hypothetical protein